MSRRRLSQNPSVKSRSTIEPVESAMVKSSKIILFLKNPKDRRRQLAFKSRIELGLFANFVKKCSFKWLLWLKTGSHLREKGQIFFKNLRPVLVLHIFCLVLVNCKYFQNLRLVLVDRKNLQNSRLVPMVRKYFQI